MSSEIYARRVARGGLIVFSSLIAFSLVNFLLRMFMVRTMSVDDYGLFFAVLTFVSVFGFFRDPGLCGALVKRIPEFIAKKQSNKIRPSIIFVLSYQVFISALVILSLVFFSSAIAPTVFKTAAAAPVLTILGLWFLFDTLLVLIQSIFYGFQNFGIQSSLQFLRAFLVLLLAIAFTWGLGSNVTSIALAFAFGLGIVVIIGLSIMMKKHSFRLMRGRPITKTLVKNLLAFAIPFFIGGAAIGIIDYADTLSITVFRTSREVGLYQAALPAARVLWFLGMSLATVFFPMTSELWAKNEKEKLKQMLSFLMRLSFVLAFLGALIFIMFPEIVINLLFGTNYLPAALAFQILSAITIFYPFYAILSTTIVGIGKPVLVTITASIMGGFNLVGNIILVQLYGFEGAAVTTFFSFLIGFTLLLYFARKFIRFPVPTSSLLKIITGGALTAGLIFITKQIIELSPWIEASVVLAISLSFYVLWIFASKVVTRADLRIIKRAIIGKKK